MAKNPWTDRTWQLMTISGTASPLMVGGEDDGRKNRFRLVVDSRSRKPNRITYYKVTFKKGAMTKHWKECMFVPRGNRPLVLRNTKRAPLAPPGPARSQRAIKKISGQLVAAVDKLARISTSRLECEITLPDMKTNAAGNALVPTGRKQFGLLRLFQAPKALGSKALLVVDFSVDRGQPGGSGGGGSVTDHH